MSEHGRAPLHLFEGVGVELEYMIVDAETLSVLPVADRVLHAVAGEYAGEVELGAISWSNELALHVIELRTTGPAPGLGGLAARFQESVREINALLAPMGGRLMPSAMHPWMDPHREMRLWPHDHSVVYQAFNRIFDCRGHGWANLQSAHLNLPFADDEEFALLHAAVRLLLPLLPALAASSPVVEGRPTGLLDSRLDVYRTNAARIPSVTGKVVPESVSTRREYEDRILRPMYEDIAPLDPEGILRHEWLNARGAIARFDRNTIEIRVLDVQECPLADLAICAFVSQLLSMLTFAYKVPGEQPVIDTDRLDSILRDTTRDGDEAVISDASDLGIVDCDLGPTCTAGELWQSLFRSCAERGMIEDEFVGPLELILREGPLARRLLRALGGRPDRGTIERVYRELCDCLAEGRMFEGA